MSLHNPTIEKHGDTFRMVYDEVYRTDIDDLWQAVTTPERLARWMADYTGDLRLGGIWHVASDGESWGRGRSPPATSRARSPQRGTPPAKSPRNSS